MDVPSHIEKKFKSIGIASGGEQRKHIRNLFEDKKKIVECLIDFASWDTGKEIMKHLEVVTYNNWRSGCKIF